MSNRVEQEESVAAENAADAPEDAAEGTAEGAPQRETGPDMRTFCMVWQRSSNAREVARITGMNVASCMTRASKYRKLGVDLKPFPKGRPRKDREERRQEIANLNALLAAILEELGECEEPQERDEADHSVEVVREILAGLRA